MNTSDLHDSVERVLVTLDRKYFLVQVSRTTRDQKQKEIVLIDVESLSVTDNVNQGTREAVPDNISTSQFQAGSTSYQAEQM